MIYKALYLAAGLISLTLGILGIVLPLLPTTPFLLLAAACFLRSSERLHLWLITHPVFGNYILAYQRFRAISARTRIMSLILLWVCILYSALVAVSILWVKLLLIFIAISVSLHLFHLNTLTSEMAEILQQERERLLMLREQRPRNQPKELV